MRVAGADMTGDIGLTGDSTLVGFVTDLTQLLDDVTHEPHTGCPYGFGQLLLMVWVMLPVNPAWHCSVCVCVLGLHVGGFHLHVSCVSCHCPQTVWSVVVQVLWRVYVLPPLWFSPQASVRVSLLGLQVWMTTAGAPQ